MISGRDGAGGSRRGTWIGTRLRHLRKRHARTATVAVLGFMILFVSWLDWATGPGSEPANLYDVPILLSAVVFGIPGVAVTAVVSSVLYCLTLSYYQTGFALSDVSQVLIFFVVGMAVAQLVNEYLAADGLRCEVLRVNEDLSRRVAEAVAAERDAQQKLRDAERLKLLGQAAAMVAHEIKNPLVSIGGFATRIQKQLLAEHSAQSGLKIIVQEVRRLEALLLELLDLGSPGCRDRHRIDVAVLVRDVLSLAHPLVQERSLQFVSTLSAPLTISGDEDHLKRALLNIVLNGVQATQPGGKVIVTVRNGGAGHEPGATIAVQDTGTGIPPEILPKIFEPFFTTKPGGTGLGLAVVKKTVEDHGGTVKIESRPRDGTVVTLWLPVGDANREAVATAGWARTARP